MNINQRLYDTRLKMVTNEYLLHPIHFFKNIDLIRERKTMYPLYQTFYLKSTKPHIPYKTAFVIEDNKRFGGRMGGIMNKKAMPKINTVFLELEERIKHNNKKNADNKKRALTLENEKYTNRVMTQKPRVLNTKYLKKLYEEKHDKYLELLLRPMKLKNNKKSNLQRTLNFRTKLPNISSTSTDGFYSKYRSSTENNMETTNEQSKENSLELAENRRHEMLHNKPGSLYAQNN
jgi:hypothetical protein